MARPNVRSLPRRLSLAIVLSAAAVVVLSCSATSLAATTATVTTFAPRQVGSLAGKWSGSYSGAFSGTFTLRWTQTGSRLHGSITLRPGGTYPITGSVRDSKIAFGAVGIGATYSGSVSGRSMSGRWHTPRGGGRWSAHKTST
jgi:hypothetical protein